jgi:hypothetical protein
MLKLDAIMMKLRLYDGKTVMVKLEGIMMKLRLYDGKIRICNDEIAAVRW